MRTLFPWLLTGVFSLGFVISIHADSKADREWRRISRPILNKYCTSCHNAADKKAGLDFYEFYYIPSVIRRGDTWRKAIEMMQNGEMPPRGHRQMSSADRDSLIYIINHVLDDALAEPNPGPPVLRRLTHREYSYTVKDLLDVDFDARSYFPKEGSGGEGFDNQSRVLYMTPLMMERYYLAADSILRQLKQNPAEWDRIVPTQYRANFIRRAWQKIASTFSPNRLLTWKKPQRIAASIIIPFATKSFRGFMAEEEKVELMQFFDQIYFDSLWQASDGFEMAMTTMFKRVLVSPIFLYRTEVNQPIHKPYEISNLELATRLSYLLWSSMPDDTLLEVAYRENLHDTTVLFREVRRMMQDEKFKRFAATFAPQWLGVEEALQNSNPDPSLFPEFTTSLRNAMAQEVIDYFHYVFTERKNMLELVRSDVSVINQTLADYYGIDDISGPEFRPVKMNGVPRGGVLGMGAVLTATSLANRTSPVLRGQWVLDQILGTPAPPPPPDVPELNESEDGKHAELSLRDLLEKHRSAPSCASCHQKMDPIGFALEQFDAIGRYRTHYAKDIPIDTRSELGDGTVIEGPKDLRMLISGEQEKFAKNFARKILSYALGRGVGFIDSPTINKIKDDLLASNFDSEKMMLNLVSSYPFRHRQSDMTNLYIKE